HEKRHALHFRGQRETQHDPALPVRAEPLEGPPFVTDPAVVVEHLQQPFVALRPGVGALLRFLDDLAGIVGCAHIERQQREPEQTNLHHLTHATRRSAEAFALRCRPYLTHPTYLTYLTYPTYLTYLTYLTYYATHATHLAHLTYLPF